MNPPKCDELDYINFLVAAQKVFSNTEAARCHPAADREGRPYDKGENHLIKLLRELCSCSIASSCSDGVFCFWRRENLVLTFCLLPI